MKDIILKYKNENPDVDFIVLSRTFGLSLEKILELFGIKKYFINEGILIVYNKNGQEIYSENFRYPNKREYKYDENERLIYVNFLDEKLELYFYYGKEFYTIKRVGEDYINYVVIEYKTNNKILKTTRNCAEISNYFYSNLGLEKIMRDGKIIETNTYDENGNLITIEYGDTYRVDYTYNENNEILTTNESSSYWSNNYYNEKGKIIKSENSNDYFILYFYDNDELKFTCDSNKNISFYKNGDEKKYINFLTNDSNIDYFYRDGKIRLSNKQGHWVKYDYDTYGNHLTTIFW